MKDEDKYTMDDFVFISQFIDADDDEDEEETISVADVDTDDTEDEDEWLKELMGE